MNSRREIDAFVAQKTFAIVGMSRAPQSFSATASKELKARGYRVFAVNPNVADIRGEKCYPNIAALPERVSAAVFVTPPAVTATAVREALEAGVKHVWIQQGAESPDALAACEGTDVNAVSKHCILMFAEPVGSMHRVHRFFKNLFGGVPH